jgi:hypothetical protein
MYRGAELGDLGGCGVVARSWDMICAACDTHKSLSN